MRGILRRFVMSQPTILKSFAELAEALNLDGLPEGPAAELLDPAAVAPTPPGSLSTLAELLAELEAASATLTAVARRDREARTLALRDLEVYDRLVLEQEAAAQARERACQVRCEAEALVEHAFADEACAAATRVASLAAQAEAAATQLAEERRQD